VYAPRRCNLPVLYTRHVALSPERMAPSNCDVHFTPESGYSPMHGTCALRQKQTFRTYSIATSELARGISGPSALGARECPSGAE
jgi:hypothetical protein